MFACMQERNVPGSNKRMIERQAALEMEVQARAQAMVDARRAEARDEVAATAAALAARPGTGLVGVMDAKEMRLRARGSSSRRRMGL
jgi:hypothetical protein